MKERTSRISRGFYVRKEHQGLSYEKSDLKVKEEDLKVLSIKVVSFKVFSMKEEDLTLSPMAEEDPKASSLKEDDLKNEQDIEGFSIMKVKDPQNIQ